MSGYAAALASLSDAQLGCLLRSRPDLLTPASHAGGREGSRPWGAGGAAEHAGGRSEAVHGGPAEAKAEPPPASFAELASRAGSPASLGAALRSLDLAALQLAELLALVGLPTTVEALAAAAGPGLSPERLHQGLAALSKLGLALPAEDGSIAGPRGLHAPFGNPGRLGPSVAELAKVGVAREQLDRIAAHLGLLIDRPTRKVDLVAAVGAALADRALVARLLAEAGEPARALLDQALTAPGPLTILGVGDGRFARNPDAEPATWLLDHGLLLPTTYSRFVVPREAAIGLRGGLVFPEWPAAPTPRLLDPVPDAPDRARAAALRLVVAAEGVLTRLDRDPLPLTQAGTVAVRDLRRLARELSLADDELAFLIDLLAEAELLAVGGPWDQRTLALRPEADAWLAGSRACRWADLAVAWRNRDLAFEDHLLPRHEPPVPGAERARPLGGHRLAATRDRRRSLLAALTRLPAPAEARVPRPVDNQNAPPSELDRLNSGGPPTGPGVATAGPGIAAVDTDDLAALLAWQEPLTWPGSVPEHTPVGAAFAARAVAVRTPPQRLIATVLAVADLAELLGLAVRADGPAGRIAAGPAAAAWAAGAGAEELAEQLQVDGALPQGSTRFLVAGDLTVVAPDGLAPHVESRLRYLADREPGSGSVWRLHEPSLRRAFDHGLGADDVLGFLREHSSTPLPQALEYLVDDAARRHGRLRVGDAATYLRGDPAQVAQVVRSAAGRKLGLRELAPGVAVTVATQRQLIAVLRKLGEAPLAEEPDGTARLESPKAVRHARPLPAQLRPHPAPRAAAGAADPAELVARLRSSGEEAAHGG